MFNIYFYSCSDDANVLNKTLVEECNLLGNLIDGTSILNPVITIQYSVNPKNFTHMYIPEFSRYYIINDISSTGRNLWTISAHVDVLQTYKGNRSARTGIYGCSAYITRNENTYNLKIIDNTYPVSSLPNIARYTFNLATGSTWNGSVKYLNDDTPVNRYYALCMGYLESYGGTKLPSPFPLATLVMNSDTFTKFTTAARESGATLSGKTTLDYIYSVGALPCSIPCDSSIAIPFKVNFPGLTASLELPSHAAGGYYYMTNNANTIETIFTLSFYAPDRNIYYLNKAPYTSYTLNFQPFGRFELDSRYFIKSTVTTQLTVRLRVVTDVLTGNAQLYYGDNLYTDVYLASANVFYKMPLSSQSYNAASLVSSAVTVAGGIASMIVTEGATAPAVGAVAGGALSAASALASPSATVYGGDTKFIDHRPTLEVTHFNITNENAAIFGRLTGETHNLYDIYGYTEIGKIHLDGITATAAEKAEIESMLQAGVIFDRI